VIAKKQCYISPLLSLFHKTKQDQEDSWALRVPLANLGHFESPDDGEMKRTKRCYMKKEESTAKEDIFVHKRRLKYPFVFRLTKAHTHFVRWNFAVGPAPDIMQNLRVLSYTVFRANCMLTSTQLTGDRQTDWSCK
jgi:hypothetical protein